MNRSNLIVGALGIVDRASFWIVTIGVIKFSEEFLGFSEMLDFCTVDPRSINVVFISGISGSKRKLLTLFGSGDAFGIKSVSDKKIFITVYYAVSSEVFEPELTILKDFMMI